MPGEGPGARLSLVFTKATIHGKPCVEKLHAGIAAKSKQADPAYPSVANAAAAQVIAIGEEAVVMMEGLHPVLVADLPGGVAVGDPIYITLADNVLVNAATALTSGLIEAAYAKFGLVSEIDTALGRAQVNLSRRDMF